MNSTARNDEQARILGRCRVMLNGAAAVISVERDDAMFTCRWSHETPAESPLLHDRIRNALNTVSTSTADGDAISAFEGALQAEGVSFGRIPAADAEGTVHFDPNTGRTVTHVSAVEGGVPMPESLQRHFARVAVDSIRRAMRGDIDGMREALAGEDAQAFVNATSQDLTTANIDAFEALVMDATAKPGWAYKAKVVCIVAADTALRADRYDLVRRLAEHGASFPHVGADIELKLQVLLGLCYTTEGNLASAKLTLERALERWPGASGPTRAWALHNLGGIAFSSGDAEAGVRALESAADLRAAAGWPLEPARTLGMAGNRLEEFNPFSALVQYDRALAILPRDASGPFAHAVAQFWGELEFARGRLLLEEAGRAEQALEAFRVAGDLLKPILESADTFASVLIWQAHCHTVLRQDQAAAKVAGEREAFSLLAGDLRSARIEAAFAGAPGANPTQAEQGAAAFKEASSLVDSDLPKALQLLEQAAAAEGSSKQPDSGLQAMLFSFGAHALWKAGKRDDAVDWQRRAAQLHPGSTAIRSTLVAFLLSARKYEICYQEACKLAAEFPVLPHGHFYAGMSSHRTGAYAEAITRLETAKSLGATSVDAVLVDAKAQLAKEPGAASLASIAAQKLGATVPPVTHMHFLEMLRRMARRIENNSEVFWKKRTDRVFKERPEGIGKALVVQDLSRDPAYRLYNEVQLPGGRMDVTVNVYGMEYVLELKMCGGSYPKVYAERGFEQLETYMKARGVTRAYLIVFDGRVTQSGAAAVPAEHELGDGQRIFCVTCNVLGIDAK